MDRRQIHAALCCSSMCPHRADPFHLLLSAKASEQHRSASNDASRRDLHREAVLRVAKHRCGITEEGVQRQSQTDSGDHARAGVSWAAARTSHVQKSPGASQVPLLIEGCCDLQTDASMELRHHVHSSAGGLCVSHGSDRLVQSICRFSQAVEQPGGCLLYRGFRGSGRALRETRDIQHRSRGPVLLDRICQCGTEQGDTIQHGRERKSPRQCFRGALVEISKV